MRKFVSNVKASEKVVKMFKLKNKKKNVITKKNACIEIVKVLNLTTYVNN